jgi:uncharacterized protein
MRPGITRRGFLTSSASLVAVIAAMQARRASAAARSSQSIAGPYGPLREARDLATGLPLILLPEGFEYRSYSWAGDPMSNGDPAPEAHDGMGVIATRGKGESLEVTLVRNHERALGSPILAPARYDSSMPAGQGRSPAGGTTTLRFRGRQWVGVEPSLGGTIYNCAGGTAPWGSWFSCEETVIDLTAKGGRRHGYVFEVRPDAAATTGRPIVDMGRMVHEALAIDPQTKIAYLTEDHARHSGFYRFLPKDRSGKPGSYEAGGRLQAARVVGCPNADLRNPQVGDEYRIDWVDIERPDSEPGIAPISVSDTPMPASGPFLQAFAAGGLRLSRGEGICFHAGRIYFIDTEAGMDAARRPGYGEGAVWELDPAQGSLRAIFVAGSAEVGDNIDNITVSPRGGILLCEDGDAGSDAQGLGTRLIGITAEGDSYAFARNNVSFELEELVAVAKQVPPDEYRLEEWAGCCFDANGEVLFANIQRPGITLAIWGPWEKGNL